MDLMRKILNEQENKELKLNIFYDFNKKTMVPIPQNKYCYIKLALEQWDKEMKNYEKWQKKDQNSYPDLKGIINSNF